MAGMTSMTALDTLHATVRTSSGITKAGCSSYSETVLAKHVRIGPQRVTYAVGVAGNGRSYSTVRFHIIRNCTILPLQTGKDEIEYISWIAVDLYPHVIPPRVVESSGSRDS
jgi:hypothetical protein